MYHVRHLHKCTQSLSFGRSGAGQLAEAPDADRHVRWCGRGAWVTAPPCRFAEPDETTDRRGGATDRNLKLKTIRGNGATNASFALARIKAGGAQRWAAIPHAGAEDDTQDYTHDSNGCLIVSSKQIRIFRPTPSIVCAAKRSARYAKPAVSSSPICRHQSASLNGSTGT